MAPSPVGAGMIKVCGRIGCRRAGHSTIGFRGWLFVRPRLGAIAPQLGEPWPLLPRGHRLEGAPAVGGIGAAVGEDGLSVSAGCHLRLREGSGQVADQVPSLGFVHEHLDLVRTQVRSGPAVEVPCGSWSCVLRGRTEAPFGLFCASSRPFQAIRPLCDDACATATKSISSTEPSLEAPAGFMDDNPLVAVDGVLYRGMGESDKSAGASSAYRSGSRCPLR